MYLRNFISYNENHPFVNCNIYYILYYNILYIILQSTNGSKNALKICYKHYYR